MWSSLNRGSWYATGPTKRIIHNAYLLCQRNAGILMCSLPPNSRLLDEDTKNYRQVINIYQQWISGQSKLGDIGGVMFRVMIIYHMWDVLPQSVWTSFAIEMYSMKHHASFHIGFREPIIWGNNISPHNSIIVGNLENRQHLNIFQFITVWRQHCHNCICESDEDIYWHMAFSLFQSVESPQMICQWTVC